MASNTDYTGADEYTPPAEETATPAGEPGLEGMTLPEPPVQIFTEPTAVPEPLPQQQPPQTTYDDDMKMMLQMFKEMKTTNEQLQHEIRTSKSDNRREMDDLKRRMAEAAQTTVPTSTSTAQTQQVPQLSKLQSTAQAFELTPLTTGAQPKTEESNDRVTKLTQRKAELRSQLLLQDDVHRQQTNELLQDIEKELTLRAEGWNDQEILTFYSKSSAEASASWKPTLAQGKDERQPNPFPPLSSNQSPPSPLPPQQSTIDPTGAPVNPTGYVQGADGKLIQIYPTTVGIQSTGAPQPTTPPYEPTPKFGNSSGQNMSYIKVPAWDGTATTIRQYKLDVALLENSISEQHRHLIASRLLGELTGVAAKYLHIEPELISDSRYKTTDGHWKLIEYLSNKLGITTRDEQHKAFSKYVLQIRRTAGETFQQYEHREELAYREMQKALQRVHLGDTGTVDLAEGIAETFQLPDSLRGWFFLERSGLKQADKTSLILQCGGETKLSKLKPLIQATYPAAVMTKYDSTRGSGHYLDDSTWTDDNGTNEGTDDYVYYGQDDPEDEYYDCDDFEDPVAIQDDQGYFVTTEDYDHSMNVDLGKEDPEYAEAYLNFTQARDVLKRLQVARQFYPVVVPASTYQELTSGRRAVMKTKGKGKGKKGKGGGIRPSGRKGGKSKSKSKSFNRPFGPRPTRKGKAGGKASNSQTTPKVDGPNTLCFKCGQPGHFARDCPSEDSNPLKRTRIDLAQTDYWDQWFHEDEQDDSTQIASVAYALPDYPADSEVLYSVRCVQPMIRRGAMSPAVLERTTA